VILRTCFSSRFTPAFCCWSLVSFRVIAGGQVTTRSTTSTDLRNGKGSTRFAVMLNDLTCNLILYTTLAHSRHRMQQRLGCKIVVRLIMLIECKSHQCRRGKLKTTSLREILSISGPQIHGDDQDFSPDNQMVC
jgi:hypothetical protein